MDELDRRGEAPMAFPLIATELGRAQQQHRAQAFSTGGDDVSGELGNQRHRAVHMLDDKLVDPEEVFFHQGQKRFQGRFSPVAAFVIEADDDGQGYLP